jgi:hypothetical protein
MPIRSGINSEAPCPTVYPAPMAVSSGPGTMLSITSMSYVKSLKYFDPVYRWIVE